MKDNTAISPLNIARMREDIHFQANLVGRQFNFCSTWGLFSPKGVDEGSRLLIDRLHVEPADRCLDLGCGYGPIGLAMASLASEGQAVLIDKDFVAIEYSKKNAVLNRLDNVDIFLSNGFSHIDDHYFDVIASNLPAKTGKELYYLYFYDAFVRMRPGARFYVVTISGLRRFIERAFKEVFGNYEKLKQGQVYTVALAVKE